MRQKRQPKTTSNESKTQWMTVTKGAKRRFWQIAFMTIAVMALAIPAGAKPTSKNKGKPLSQQPAPPSSAYAYDKVVSVNTADSTIAVTDGKFARTIKVTPLTKIKVYGDAGTLDDIKVGMTLDISATGGDTAGRIEVVEVSKAKAKNPSNKPAVPRSSHEKVVSVNTADSTIKVTDEEGQHRRTITLTAFTAITVYGKPGTLEDLKSGMKVDICFSTGNVASRIEAIDPSAAKKSTPSSSPPPLTPSSFRTNVSADPPTAPGMSPPLTPSSFRNR